MMLYLNQKFIKGGFYKMNDRIKYLRAKILKLSQESFGEKIGLSKSGISNIENGIRNVTEQHIKLICSEFNVNENWLRTGEGIPFKQTSSSAMEQLCQEFNLNEFDANLVYEYLKLSPENRTVIRNFVNKIADTSRHSSPYNEFPANPSALVEEPVKHKAI